MQPATARKQIVITKNNAHITIADIHIKYSTNRRMVSNRINIVDGSHSTKNNLLTRIFHYQRPSLLIVSKTARYNKKITFTMVHKIKNTSNKSQRQSTLLFTRNECRMATAKSHMQAADSALKAARVPLHAYRSMVHLWELPLLRLRLLVTRHHEDLLGSSITVQTLVGNGVKYLLRLLHTTTVLTYKYVHFK